MKSAYLVRPLTIKGDYFLENRKLSNSALKPLDDTDVTTWKLPDGAIARLGQGVISDMAFHQIKRLLLLQLALEYGCMNSTPCNPSHYLKLNVA